MNIQFDNFHTGDASLVELDGESISLTFDHLWDKNGRQPILIAYFNGDFWKRADTGHSYTDIHISPTWTVEIDEPTWDHRWLPGPHGDVCVRCGQERDTAGDCR